MKKLLLITLFSFNLFANNGFVTAEVGFAEHGNDNCTIHIEITNNTNNLFVEASLDASLLVFDHDGILVPHASFDANEVYLRIPTRVFKPGNTVVVDRGIDSSFWGNNKSQCANISQIEFNLREGNAKNARGEKIDFSKYLDTTIKKYAMDKLQILRW